MHESTAADRQEIAAGVPFRTVNRALLAFYALLVALNAVAWHEANERLPYGAARTMWVSVTGPLARVCRAMGLDRPRTFLTETLGSVLNGSD